MTTPVNSRDIYLQAASTRVTDEVLTKEEKPSLISSYTSILQDQIVLDADATKYIITTEKTDYDTAVAALTTYLGTLTIPVSWNNTTNMTYVNRSFLNIKLNNISTNKKVLQLAIGAKAAVTGYLTKPAVTLAADSGGTPSSLSPGVGVFRVFSGTTEVTGSLVTYSVVTQTGLTVSVASATGVYTLNSISAPTASAVLRATYNGFSIDCGYTVAKATAGTNGSNGSSGSNGQRGTVTVAISGYSSWPSTTAGANAAFSTTGYSSPVDRDIMTLYNSSFSETRYYQSGSWIALTSYINGNMLVSGTLSADKIYGGTLDGVVIKVGTGHTLSSRAFEVTSGGWVWADNITCGNLTAGNNYYPFNAAFRAESVANYEAIVGSIYSSVTGGAAHGVRGQNQNRGTSGLVGAGNTFDFYADGSGTNYGPFTGAHDVLIPIDSPIEVGDIVYDSLCIERRGLSNTIFEVKATVSPKTKSCIGILVHNTNVLSEHEPAAFIKEVYLGVDPSRNSTRNVIMTDKFEEVKNLYLLGAVNALGEGQMNVCGEAGDIEAGDYIVSSSTKGKGMRQDDDILHNYTVAKARESCSFSSLTEIKTIACTYHCG